MAKQGAVTAMPRLRFPEFREAGAWSEAKLDSLIDTVSPPAKLPSSSYLATGKFPIIDQSQDAICGRTDDPQVVIEKPLPLIVFGDHTCVLKFVARPFAQGADGIKILAAKPSISIDYLFHSLNHQPLVMEDYKRHFSTLKERQVFFPGVESGEQQKISDCLTSLDAIIAAQGRKVEALKAHKRGLMQQLFPREGETRPRLRFPEFRNAPEWKGKLLGEAATFYNGRAYAKEELLERGKYLVLRVGNFFTNDHWYYSDLELDDTKYCDEGDLLYAWSASFGPRMWRGGKTIYHYHIWKVVEKEGVSKAFLFYRLDADTEEMRARTANGIGMFHITKGTIESWMSAFPNLEEQQRIADCLSSLDTRITAETSQLAALKTHKQGLMQQLFPAPEAAQV